MSNEGNFTGTQAQTILFDLVKELKDEISNLTTKFDNVSTRLAYVEGADMKNTLDSMNGKLDNLEAQVNRIDKNQAVIYAIAAFVGGLVSLGIGWVKGLFVS